MSLRFSAFKFHTFSLLVIGIQLSSCNVVGTRLAAVCNPLTLPAHYPSSESMVQDSKSFPGQQLFYSSCIASLCRSQQQTLWWGYGRTSCLSGKGNPNKPNMREFLVQTVNESYLLVRLVVNILLELYYHIRLDHPSLPSLYLVKDAERLLTRLNDPTNPVDFPPLLHPSISIIIFYTAGGLCQWNTHTGTICIRVMMDTHWQNGLRTVCKQVANVSPSGSNALEAPS
jgi:hypothetical protein